MIKKEARKVLVKYWMNPEDSGTFNSMYDLLNSLSLSSDDLHSIRFALRNINAKPYRKESNPFNRPFPGFINGWKEKPQNSDESWSYVFIVRGDNLQDVYDDMSAADYPVDGWDCVHAGQSYMNPASISFAGENLILVTMRGGLDV